MKFTYNKTEEERKVVAVLTYQGNIMFMDRPNGYRLTLMHGKGNNYHLSGAILESAIAERFYEGDKITITL